MTNAAATSALERVDSEPNRGQGAVKYRRVLLKISGEALAGEEGFGFAPPVIDRCAP